MESAFWDGVVAGGHQVPTDRPLADLTAELTTMLGDPDPRRRDGIAYPTLATWVSEGVYDDLLQGLGDGMAAGLTVGLGEDGTDTVFRRSFSAMVLAECIDRASGQRLLPTDSLLPGATGSPGGWCASATCAGSCPARAGRTRWPTAPTPSGCWRAATASASSS